MYIKKTKENLSIQIAQPSDLKILQEYLKEGDVVSATIYREPRINIEKRGKLDKIPQLIEFKISEININEGITLKGYINSAEIQTLYLTPGKDFNLHYTKRDLPRVNYLMNYASHKDHKCLVVEVDRIWYTLVTPYCMRVIKDFDITYSNKFLNEITQHIEKFTPDIVIGHDIVNGIKHQNVIITEIENLGPPFFTKSRKLQMYMSAARSLEVQKFRERIIHAMNMKKLFHFARIDEYGNRVKIIYIPAKYLHLVYEFDTYIYNPADIEDLVLPDIFFEIY